MVSGKMFLVNQQYEYSSTQVILIGCGCGGKKKESVLHYLVIINGTTYKIPYTNCVVTTVHIAVEDQDFRAKIADIGNRAPDGSKINNYDGLRSRPNPDEIASSANNIPM